MKTVRSRLLELLAEKGQREGRRISVRQAWQESGVSKRVAYGLANDTLREYPAEALAAMCAYLGCEVGDLLRLEGNEE